jgi:F-type H+-transporting ATPase subunit a
MISLFPIFADEVPEAGMTQKPVELFHIGPFAINNSMIAEALACVLVVTVVQIAMRQPKLVPTGLQNFVEWLVELMSNFLEQLAGRETMQRGFWYFGSLLVFILAENMLALFPGFGTFGWGHYTSAPLTDGSWSSWWENLWKFEVTQPFLRGANANVNVTAAYAAIFFFMYFYWCVRQAGVGGSLFHIFGSKTKFANQIVNWAFIVIFFLVGWIEVFSILIIRPIAFTFRLFGNIFGGEFLLDSMYKMAPNFAFIILVPFYFYELMVAFVQAFVFFALTAAFTGMITNAGDHSEDSKDGH